MHQLVITDSFSIDMLPQVGIDKTVWVEFDRLSTEKVRSWVHEKNVLVESAVENADIAELISRILDINLQVEDKQVKLLNVESLIVAQYSRRKIPEGIIIPYRMMIKFWQALIPWYYEIT